MLNKDDKVPFKAKLTYILQVCVSSTQSLARCDTVLHNNSWSSDCLAVE